MAEQRREIEQLQADQSEQADHTLVICTALPVRFARRMWCASFREGCLQLYTQWMGVGETESPRLYRRPPPTPI